MPLEDEDGFFHRNLTVLRRSVGVAVEFWVVRLVLFENVVDGSQQHSGDGDDGFLVTPALFESKIAVADFWELFGSNSVESALNEQRLDVGSGTADPGGFLLPGTLVVLRRKPRPGAKMLRGGKHGHIHSDFRNDANSGKGLDTRHPS